MIDKYGRQIDYMRISVTELCNLRCRYCMPEEGIVKRDHEEMMTAEETIDAVKAAVSLGVKKIRVTGGEPLVKRGIVELCENIAAVDGVEELCMTTNGTLLPGYARELRAAGVDRVNISLDTLKADRYREITRIGELMGGFNDDEIEDFVRLTIDRPLEVRFIELMPIGGGIEFEKARFISCVRVLESVPGLEPLDMTDGVAAMYALPGAKGRVGLIRPISCDFCEGCNKIRLTADGMLKPCLHSGAEISIKGRSREEMTEVIREAILSKPQMRETLDAENPSHAGRNMNSIGG